MIFNKIKHFFKQRIFEYRLEKQIDKANRLRKKTGYHYAVVMWKGKPKAMPIRTLKEMIRRKIFKKSITIERLKRNALYITV